MMLNVVNEIELRNAWWLLLVLQPLVLFSVAAVFRYLRHDEFADPQLLPWVRRQQLQRKPIYLLRWLSLCLAWCLLALAMAGPRIALQTIDTGDEQATEVQVVVDVSRSMSARDVLPSRIERARLELMNLIDNVRDTRLGLLVYAARAHVMLPPTQDKEVLRHAAGLLQTGHLPTEGSELLGAVRYAAQQFTQRDQPRAILLISDGEMPDDNQTEIDALLTELKQANIRLYVLGMGTRQGAPLLGDAQGWLQHAGRAVVARLHSERLRLLAEGGNGQYAEVSDDDSDWQLLYNNGIARLQAANRKVTVEDQIIWRDLSAWFVLPGLGLLLLAYLHLPVKSVASNKPALFILCVLLGNGGSVPAEAAVISYAEAYATYRQGEYQLAAKQFAQLKGYRARLAEGVSHYQLQAYQAAAANFIQATLDAETDQQRAMALFNLGNAYFKQDAFLQAEQVYRDVLRYVPRWQAVQINLEYARVLKEKQSAAEPGLATRAGSGSRSARVADDVEITQGQLGLDSSESETQTEPAPAANGDQQMTLTPLQQAAPATEKIEREEDVSWSYDINDASGIQRQHTQFKVDEAVIWQRLFEIEEGFPAPRERPHTLPGTEPW